MQPSSFNKAMSCALGKVGSQECHWRTNNWWRLYGKEVFCMATNGYSKYTCTVCNHASHPRWKAEVACCHRGLASYGSTRCSYTLPSYILPNISVCCYLWVQLTYLNELYGECNRTCVNSGYQVLLSNFCQVPGMRLYNRAIMLRCHYRMFLFGCCYLLLLCLMQDYEYNYVLPTSRHSDMCMY